MYQDPPSARQIVKILTKPTGELPTYNILAEELKTIPLEYRRHLKVFSETQAQRLPLDCPWNHAIDLKPNAFFIKKKNGTLRPIYNYCQLNKWTIKNHYPLPLIGELVYRL